VTAKPLIAASRLSAVTRDAERMIAEAAMIASGNFIDPA
jgi:hypothetical protein